MYIERLGIVLSYICLENVNKFVDIPPPRVWFGVIVIEPIPIDAIVVLF